MTILKNAVSESKITIGAKKHLKDVDKIYGDREVKTVQLKNKVVKSDKSFHIESFFMKKTDPKNKNLKEEKHKVRYVRKNNRISIIHLDRE